MNKKQEIQNIKQIWLKIERVLNNTGWNMYGTDYLKQNRDETRNHIGFKPVGVFHGLTITEEAKFFAVQRISQYLYNDKKPSLEDFMHHVKSDFMAYALAFEFKDKLKEILNETDVEHITKLDYCKFAQEDW